MTAHFRYPGLDTSRFAPTDSPTPRVWIAVTAALACLLALCISPAPVEARSQRDTRYLYRQVWPAAVRLLRVDKGYDIVEKDVDAGYVLFDVKEDRKKFRGSLELVRLEGESRNRVRVIIRIADRPSYVELGLLDNLERKLREEYGSPPKSTPKPPSGANPGRSPDMDARH